MGKIKRLEPGRVRSSCALEDWLPPKDSTRRGTKLEPIALTKTIVSADRPSLSIAAMQLLGAICRWLRDKSLTAILGRLKSLWLLLKNFSVASRINVHHRSNDVRFELESCLVHLLMYPLDLGV